MELFDNLKNDSIKYRADENYLKKISIKKFLENKNNQINNIFKDIKNINVSSPLFEELSKLNDFEKNFSVAINFAQIKKNNLEINDIINKLKNIKYIIYYIINY